MRENPLSNVVAVAAGQVQGLALLANSTVYSWGLLTNGFSWNVTNQPNLTNVTAIACGTTFDMALSNGTVVAWGSASDGEISVPSYLSNVVAIAAHGYHGMALQSNGTVVTWGTVPGNLTNPPPLTNPVAIATGYTHFLALQSNGTVVAWGLNSSGQCTIPAAAQSNVIAIAAGDYFSMALLYNGTVVEWGDNTYWQTNVPQSDPNQPVVLKYIAAGGSHSMAAIWSPSQQYPVNINRDVLLVYTTQSAVSTNVFNYYRTNRPLATNFNVLGINCPAGEGISWYNYTNSFVAPIVTWLNTNQMKWPKYVILFPDLPSRYTNSGGGTASVQYDMNVAANAEFGTVNYSVGWHPYVTAINMNGLNGSNDCFAYINKLTNMAAGKQTLFISASSNGYGNANWYFDDAQAVHPYSIGLYAEQGVETNGVSSSDVFYAPLGNNPHITGGTNVSGYYTWGYNGGLTGAFPTNGAVLFTNASTWYLMGTAESFNGQRSPSVGPQSSFLEWFATNAFMGTNSSQPLYTNTPVGAISHVDEPYEYADNTFDYFGLWAAGRSFAICAWAGQTGTYSVSGAYPPDSSDFWFQATGDPFVTK